MKRICLIFLLLALLGTIGADVLSPDEFAQRVFKEVNAIRQRNGLPELLWLDDLADLALQHSRNMAWNGFFDHVDHEGLQISQRQKLYFPELLLAGIGENLFFIENSRKIYDPKEIALGWMNSEGHRKNLLHEEFTHTGIGVFLLEDELFTTQVFALPVLKRISELPQSFTPDQAYPLEFEYLSLEPKASFACQLGTPDPNTRVQLDLLTYTLGSMPLEIIWKDESRLILPLEFKYGRGSYTLRLGWDGYFYPDMLEFRVE
ncbi:MAG: CAP domain-containing protein [Candidatus Cloacimonetes bacterium]|nr:CAP domain-containing protein [Candidatus Cloacimonadota bacterium]